VESFRITPSGQISIGTDDPKTYRLAVNGDAMFTRIKVKQYATWPDYVFHRHYQLPSLENVEDFIKKNHHLPAVPSTEEIQKTGLDLGDNQVMLLQKIEELTLYIIDINKQMIDISKKVENLKKENQVLKKKLIPTRINCK
jgi:hypothetical protein